MSTEQGDVEALRSWIERMRERDEWPDTDLSLMDAIERVCAALERAERERDEEALRARGRLAELGECERRAEKVERALARGVEVASQFMNTGRGDLDGWIEANCAAFRGHQR